MGKLPFVTFRRDHPFPISHDDWRKAEEELQMMGAWMVDRVEDLVDDSARFIEEEMCRLDIDPEQVDDIKKRIMCGLVSQWAKWILELYSSHDPVLLDPVEIGIFLKRRFDIDLGFPISGASEPRNSVQ